MASCSDKQEDFGTHVNKNGKSSDEEPVVIQGSEMGSRLRATTLYFSKTQNVLCDIKVVLKDGIEFDGHRFVLMSRSEFLKNKILSEKDERMDQVVNLDFDSKLFGSVWDFMYTDHLEICKENLETVVDIAKQLGISDLYKLGMSLMLCNAEVTPGNCLELWRISHEIDDQNLTERAKPVALQHFVLLQHSPAFKALPAACVKEYIQNLKANSVEECVSAVLSWASSDSKNRANELEDILESIPIDKAQPWFLEHLTSSCTEAVNVIKKEERKRKEEEEKKLAECTKEKNRQAAAKGTCPPTLTAFVLEENIPKPKVVPKPEKCLIMVGVGAKGHISNEVYAVRLEKNFSVVSLGKIPAVFPSWTSCCVSGDVLYVSGLGQSHQEVWTFDMKQKLAQFLAR